MAMTTDLLEANPGAVAVALGTGEEREKEPAIPPPQFVATSDPIQPKYVNEAEQTFTAQRRSPSGQRKMIEHFFEREARTEPWATEMENTLNRRFSKKSFEAIGLKTMTLDKLECRKSSCRLDLSWAHDDTLAAAATRPNEASWPDPGAHILYSTGPFAAVEGRIELRPSDRRVPSAWNVRFTDENRYATSSILLFGKEDIDPSTYESYVEQNHERLKVARSGAP
jgi:hypothetical protein